ncbi:MAG: chemotaxis protein [Thiomonas sp.]|nr:chemotaxis protein [Thiomonas sp.]
MKRTPQRSLLLFWLVALAWGGGLAALVWTAPAQPGLLLTAWVAGAALLLLLALYLGLSFRLDLLQVQQALREASAEHGAAVKGRAALAAIWWPLIDAATAQQPLPQAKAAAEAARSTAHLQAQIDALQAALAAERAQGHTWQQQAAQTQAERNLLQRQLQDAAQALEPLEATLDAAIPLPQMLPDAAAADAQQPVAQRQALDKLAAELSTLTTECQAQARAMHQRDADASARTQARAAQQTQAAATLRQHAQRLTQTIDDLQLLGLNLRLQLSHLSGVPCDDAAAFAQTEADLDVLLGRTGQLSEAARALHRTEDAPTDAHKPESTTEIETSAQRLERLQRMTGDSIAMAQSLVAQRDDAARQRTQLHAALRQQAQQFEALRLQLQSLHQGLKRAARNNS